MVINGIASVFVDCPLFFSPEEAAAYPEVYRYILVIFWVEVRVCGNSVM